ncbi:MAG: porin, partial [Prevotella sp.]|nr:porin [Prevotella sp.]
MNSNRFFAILMATTMSATVFAETETESNTKAVEQTEASKLNMDNGVIPIADDRGFTLQSNDGNFVFKPYLFMQTTANFKYYDDEGLDKAYNQDNVANSGFAIPYAIIGFTGKAFGKIDYNVCVNAAASGGNILQQAWIDYAVCPELRFRAGKFKTPFTHA